MVFVTQADRLKSNSSRHILNWIISPPTHTVLLMDLSTNRKPPTPVMKLLSCTWSWGWAELSTWACSNSTSCSSWQELRRKKFDYDTECCTKSCRAQRRTKIKCRSRRHSRRNIYLQNERWDFHNTRAKQESGFYPSTAVEQKVSDITTANEGVWRSGHMTKRQMCCPTTILSWGEWELKENRPSSLAHALGVPCSDSLQSHSSHSFCPDFQYRNSF